MATFQPSDAAISGFRFISRQPRTVAIWAGIFFLCEVAYGLVLVGLARDNLQAVRALQEANRTDPAAAISMLPAVGLLFLFTLALVLACATVMFAAAYRAWAGTGDRRRAYLELGPQELRMAVLIVLWAVLAVGGSFVIAFVSGMLGALGTALPRVVAPIYYLALSVGVAAAFVYPIVRLSLAMPMTMDDHHIRLFESWKATRGCFWPLFSAYALAAILIIVLVICEWALVTLVAAIVIVTSGLSITDLSGLFRSDTTSIASYFRVTTIIAMVLHALALGAGLPIFTGPVAEAYRRFVLHEGAEPDADAASAS